MTKQTFCALVALLLIVANLSDAQRVPQKRANGACIYDPTDRALTLEFYADYNGDPVDKVLAINGRVYDRANNNEASPTCTYTLRDGSSEKILIRSTIYTDGSQTDDNPCGGRRTNPNNANSFEWTISLREHFAEQVYRELDQRFLIVCIIANANSPYVTTNFQVFGADEEEDAMRVRPSNEMSVLEQVGANYQLVDATVNIGQYIKLRIQSNLHELYEDHLHHYGCMAFNCIRSRSASFQNPTTFIGQTGCPAATDPFGLTGGFTKATVLVEPDGYFRLETEAFIFAPTKPPQRTRYFIACFLEYCYGNYDATNPANNDQRCENLCLYNSAAKRRRRSESLSNKDRVILAVDVDPGSPVDNKPNDPEKSQQTTLIAVTTVIGLLILAIIIIIVVLLLVARRRRYKADDTSSQGSSNDLSIHTVMKS